ncbi:hypothetical protein ACOMHN_066148 [Nucella lapillus]
MDTPCCIWWAVVWSAVMIVTTAGSKKDITPYLSQFPSDVTFKSQHSKTFNSSAFQYLRVWWLRQTQNDDSRVVMAGYYAHDDEEPQVAWLVNGRLVHESDGSIKQTVEKSSLQSVERDVIVASITIPHAIGVTSLKLLLVLQTIETLTDVNLQDLQTLDSGRSIMEQGTDVALALSPQEDVTFKAGDDVIFLTRFFAEEITSAASESVDVRYLRMLPTNPDVTLEIVTSESKPDVMTTWEPEMNEVPSSLHKHFNSDLRRHQMVKLTEDIQNVRGLVEFTADYTSSTPCRLFGGQKITRRAFIRATSDRGGYWGRGGPMVFLPFERSIPVSCGANVDVTVAALGELSPFIYLVKDGEVKDSGNGVTIILFRRLLQTEAVFRFENVTPEIGGDYLVWAENSLGRTDETGFSLVLDGDCR